MSGRMALVAWIGSACVSTSGLAAVIDISGGNVTMNQLVGNSFIVGDKEFFIDFFTPFGIPGTAVTARPVNFGLNGIGFDLVGAWNDPPGDPNSTGFNLGYRVQVLAPFAAQGFRIVDAHLSFNGTATGAGSFAKVAESMFNQANGAPLGNMLVMADGGVPQGQWTLNQSIVFAPVLEINVIKNFQLFANGANGTATTSFVRQTFSQVPAPGGAALIGLAGLATLRRRR